jgi:hypothetical protein
MHITKEGDQYVRCLLVRSAHYILGPFGAERRATVASLLREARRAQNQPPES